MMGVWIGWLHAEHSTLQESTQKLKQLTEKNAALETENAQLRQKCARMTEESNMEKFKCQLLVEMVRPHTTLMYY